MTKNNKTTKKQINKKFNIKPIIEKAKTITLIIIVASAAGFYAGVNYENTKQSEIQKQATEISAVSLKANQ